MTFNVSKTHIAGTSAEAADLNQVNSELEAELNAFPTDGSLKSSSVGYLNLTDSCIESLKTWPLNGVDTVVHTKFFTGTLTSAGLTGGVFTVSHGLSDMHKILSVSYAIWIASYDTWYLPGRSETESTSQIYAKWNDSVLSCTVGNLFNNGSNKYSFKIEYID
jgi:hypothetical protein